MVNTSDPTGWSDADGSEPGGSVSGSSGSVSGRDEIFRSNWWQRRLLLSTLLALSLCTFFIVSATWRKSLSQSSAAGDSSYPAEEVITVVFPDLPLLAVVICWLTDIAIVLFQTDSFNRKNPVASVLVATLLRTMVILGALGMSSATKWPAHNLFGNYLVGCYFSFLALESWLAIRRSATRNFSPKPL